MNNTAAPAAAPLADLTDDELVIETRTAWFAGLTNNTFAGIRECQAEALRRGKPHLYDQGLARHRRRGERSGLNMPAQLCSKGRERIDRHRGHLTQGG